MNSNTHQHNNLSEALNFCNVLDLYMILSNRDLQTSKHKNLQENFNTSNLEHSLNKNMLKNKNKGRRFEKVKKSLNTKPLYMSCKMLLIYNSNYPLKSHNRSHISFNVV